MKFEPSKINYKMSPTPLVVIVGPTGSGKSALALEVAKQFGGEIICADSRTVYKGMDIGTAKPAAKEQLEVPHYLIDLVGPDELFNAAAFKNLALGAINEIGQKGRLPIMVGGTGLYIDAVIFDFAFLPPVESEERERLQLMSVKELQQMISNLGFRLPENDHNPRHLIRTIETNGAVAVKRGMRSNTLFIGIDISKDELIARLEKRVNSMIEQGLKKEVVALADKYGWEAPGMNSVGYQEWRGFFAGSESEQYVSATILSNSIKYAKRQRTWFRRNPNIKWVKNSSEAVKLIEKFLQHNKA